MSFCVWVPLSGPIPPGHLFPHSGSRSGCCMFVWDMGLDEPSGRPLNTFLCSPPDSLGRRTNWFGRWLFRGPHFITFGWRLSTSHSYFCAVLLLTHAQIQLRLCRTPLKEARGSCTNFTDWSGWRLKQVCILMLWLPLFFTAACHYWKALQPCWASLSSELFPHTVRMD